MRGRYFLEVVDNQLVAQGFITGEAGPGLWLCELAGPLPVERVIPAQRMAGFHLFKTPQQMDQWIHANATPEPAAPVPIPIGGPNGSTTPEDIPPPDGNPLEEITPLSPKGDDPELPTETSGLAQVEEIPDPGVDVPDAVEPGHFGEG